MLETHSDNVTACDDGIVGRGVRARVALRPGAIVERCPVIVVPARQLAALDRTVLYGYYYAWGVGDRDGAIALGCGSLYNHSADPNAEYRKDLAAGVVEIWALHDIAAGEEIFVDYSAGGTNPLWFHPV